MTEKIKTKAKITCPSCGHIFSAKMPTNACQHFLKCEKCEKMMSPKKGDCCVFCSYADTKCPPKQKELAK